jgi:hypothetical protein
VKAAKSIYCECGAEKPCPKSPCCARCAVLDGVNTRAWGNVTYALADVVGILRECPGGLDVNEIACQTGRMHRSALRALQKLQSRGRIVRRLEPDESTTRPRAIYYLTLPKGMN